MATLKYYDVGSGTWKYVSTGPNGLAAVGTTKITVGTVEPADPEVGDLWVDTN